MPSNEDSETEHRRRCAMWVGMFLAAQAAAAPLPAAAAAACTLAHHLLATWQPPEGEAAEAVGQRIGEAIATALARPDLVNLHSFPLSYQSPQLSRSLPTAQDMSMFASRCATTGPLSC